MLTREAATIIFDVMVHDALVKYEYWACLAAQHRGISEDDIDSFIDYVSKDIQTLPSEQREPEEVIHCKDCIYWGKPNSMGVAICEECSAPNIGYNRATASNGYCAWAEPKDK